MTIHDAKKQLALVVCKARTEVRLKRQLAPALCKARTDVKLKRQYEPTYMLSEEQFHRFVVCEAPQIYEISAEDETLSCFMRSETQYAIKNAYAALVSEFTRQ